MRNLNFKNKTNNRYWWHNLQDTDYIPDIYRSLSDQEWIILQSWFDETEKEFSGTAEMQIPGISLISSLINGNGISRIIQCGHYIGYSSLLLGFLLKRMNKNNCIFSIDIDPKVTEYTLKWLKKSKLEDQVKLYVGDSADPTLLNIVNNYFNNQDPQLIIIDSSHQFHHTIKELDLWWDTLCVGGFLVMHDISVFASSFDSTKSGGVNKAIDYWLKGKNYNFLGINKFFNGQMDGNSLSYKDGCGLGILQKH